MTFFLVELHVFPVKACFCSEKLMVTSICKNTLILDAHRTFSCSKLTMETPEQYNSFWCLYCYLLFLPRLFMVFPFLTSIKQMPARQSDRQ